MLGDVQRCTDGDEHAALNRFARLLHRAATDERGACDGKGTDIRPRPKRAAHDNACKNQQREARSLVRHQNKKPRIGLDVSPLDSGLVAVRAVSVRREWVIPDLNREPTD